MLTAQKLLCCDGWGKAVGTGSAAGILMPINGMLWCYLLWCLLHVAYDALTLVLNQPEMIGFPTGDPGVSWWVG